VSIYKLKTTNINNRRYLGNKIKLLPIIRKVVEENCANVSSVADIFAGTGAVASAFVDKQLIINDYLYSNYISYVAWFDPQDYSRTKIERLIAYYNEAKDYRDNYMSENFANTYFSLDNSRKIGFIREDIESRYTNTDINERERALLIASLLYAADRIANTCGHYDAYRQGLKFDKPLELLVPLTFTTVNCHNKCYNEDANNLVKKIRADLIYIDPPYNSRQYSNSYHILENIARWEKPQVIGVAKKMVRQNLKSDYCTREATVAFEDLIKNINASFILLSYNNMGQKGDRRSNAKIKDADIIRILSAKGEIQTFVHDHKPFFAGKSDIDEHQERLFLCVCQN
jgi:adenine-specific DNA-methyltransferase